MPRAIKNENKEGSVLLPQNHPMKGRETDGEMAETEDEGAARGLAGLYPRHVLAVEWCSLTPVTLLGFRLASLHKGWLIFRWQ